MRCVGVCVTCLPRRPQWPPLPCLASAETHASTRHDHVCETRSADRSAWSAVDPPSRPPPPPPRPLLIDQSVVGSRIRSGGGGRGARAPGAAGGRGGSESGCHSGYWRLEKRLGTAVRRSQTGWWAFRGREQKRREARQTGQGPRSPHDRGNTRVRRGGVGAHAIAPAASGPAGPPMAPSTDSAAPPPRLLKDWAKSSSGPSLNQNIFSGAFGASPIGPKHFFGASDSSASTGGGREWGWRDPPTHPSPPRPPSPPYRGPPPPPAKTRPAEAPLARGASACLLRPNLAAGVDIIVMTFPRWGFGGGGGGC